MTLVVDASVVVAALIDGGPTGTWAETLLAGDQLAAPHLMPVEAANVLRRSAMAGAISSDVAALAHADLLALRVALFPYHAVADRAWALSDTISTSDAWYVAVAEATGGMLATLDLRLANAPGPRCAFLTPPPES